MGDNYRQLLINIRRLDHRPSGLGCILGLAGPFLVKTVKYSHHSANSKLSNKTPLIINHVLLKLIKHVDQKGIFLFGPQTQVRKIKVRILPKGPHLRSATFGQQFPRPQVRKSSGPHFTRALPSTITRFSKFCGWTVLYDVFFYFLYIIPPFSALSHYIIII